MTFLLPLLANLRHYWKPIGFTMLALAAGIYIGALKMDARHWHKKFDREAAAHLADNNTWIAAQQLANARATSLKLAAEARFSRIQEDNAHALTLARADARDLLTRRLRERSKAPQGQPGQADLRGAPDTAPGPDGTPTAALVDVADLQRCTNAVIGFEGWQAWYRDILNTQKVVPNGR